MDPKKIAEMLKQMTDDSIAETAAPQGNDPVVQAENTVVPAEETVVPNEETVEKVDPMKILLEEFANLKQMVIDQQKPKKAVEPVKQKESFDTNDLVALIEQTVERKTKEAYVNTLTPSEKEFIKSIPGNESFSQATINAILSKKGLPKVSVSTPVAKEDTLEDLVKKIRGIK